MNGHSSDSEDEDFDVEPDVTEDGETILQRLKEFSYYLVENIEANLDLCLNLLEERNVPAKSNSIPTTVLSKLLHAVPKVGGAAGNAISKGETIVLERIDKKNSRILADLVYYYSDHKEEMRKMIIEASVDIFRSFECQFRKLTCDEGQKKAMQKLAKDAADRIFNYFLDTEQKRDITKDEITKGILLGNSNRNKVGIREGRTVMYSKSKWKTNKLYLKTGIVIVEENAFYTNKDCHTEKYGHRCPLSWEHVSDIKNNWEQENGFQVPHYSLTVTEDLIKSVRDYIMTKFVHDEAKLERESYNKEALDDRNLKHEEVLTTFREHFKELLDDLEHQYKVISDNRNENIQLLQRISEKQDDEKIVKHEFHIKLQEIHEDVRETKALVEINKTMQEDITTIKNSHEELAKSVAPINLEDIEKLVKKETMKDTEEKLKELVKEKLRKNDPGPRIRREVERNLKKLRIKF